MTESTDLVLICAAAVALRTSDTASTIVLFSPLRRSQQRVSDLLGEVVSLVISDHSHDFAPTKLQRLLTLEWNSENQTMVLRTEDS